jgi:signal transduction histidine kinase
MTARPRVAPARRIAIAVCIVAAGVAAALIIAARMGATRDEVVELLALGAGTSAAVALVGIAVLRTQRHRSLTTQVVAVALVAIAATGAGVAVAAWAMFFSAHDLGVLGVVLVLSAAVAAATAWLLGGAYRASIEAVHGQIDALGRDEPAPVPDVVVTDELAQVSGALAEAHRQLVASREVTRRLEASRRELVAWVSHDLRSPIAAIRAMAEALEDAVVDDPADVAGYHTAIRLEAQRLGQLVDDLFELSRIEAGAVPSDITFVPAHELVAEVVSTAEARGVAEQVAVQAELDDLGPELVVAADLRRALENVLDNAIRHTGAGGVVRVRSAHEGQHVVLVVADECGGIPADELPRVFEVAFRGDASRSRSAAGGGLGLAIAKGLVEARSGAITVENVEGGCEFRISVHAPRSV